MEVLFFCPRREGGWGGGGVHGTGSQQLERRQVYTGRETLGRLFWERSYNAYDSGVLWGTGKRAVVLRGRAL